MKKKKLIKRGTKKFNKFYSKFVYCDGGRWTDTREIGMDVAVPKKNPYALTITKNSKTQIIGDCAVRALAVVCERPYKDVVAMARRHRWSMYNGWINFGSFLYHNYFFDKEAEYVQTWGNRGKTTTVFSFLKDYPKGTYILLTTDFNNCGHALVVKDGRVYDTFLGDDWVYCAYKIVDKTN